MEFCVVALSRGTDIIKNRPTNCGRESEVEGVKAARTVRFATPASKTRSSAGLFAMRDARPALSCAKAGALMASSAHILVAILSDTPTTPTNFDDCENA
jgi:hypothetical protein